VFWSAVEGGGAPTVCKGADRASRINGFVGNVALSGGFLTLIAQSV
jgi:hypothetical protein